MKKVTDFIMDLISSQDKTKKRKVSHTKMWSNIGMACMTVIFLYKGFGGSLEEWYGWMYAAVVTPTALLSKYLNYKFQQREQQENHSRFRYDEGNSENEIIHRRGYDE